MNHVILSVLGKDQPGIIAAITGELFLAGSNLEDISMTILEGQFAMILVCALPQKRRLDLKKRLDRLSRKLGVSVTWKESGSIKRGEKHLKNSTPYMISVFGKDRTGIVYRVSRFLAREGINVTDLNSRIIGRGSKGVYLMLLEADIPKRISLNKIRRGLQRLASQLKVELQIKPVDLITV